MAKKTALPDPKAFNLSSFADILPKREPILGEDPGSFETFHQGLMASLAPATPYECVIAENLIAIEWELLQRRRMREAMLSRQASSAVEEAVFSERCAAYEDARDEAFDKHLENGGDEDDWEEPDFDEEAARAAGADLAARAVSSNSKTQAGAWREIAALGMDPVEVMSNAFANAKSEVYKHDNKVQELERRRREVRRDFDALQKARPLEPEVIEG